MYSSIRRKRPFLEDGVPLTRLARERRIVLRTARRWVERYRKNGLVGLVRKERNDKDERKLLPDLQQIIEGLALSRPKLSARRFQPDCVKVRCTVISSK
jgi:putative transposase